VRKKKGKAVKRQPRAIALAPPPPVALLDERGLPIVTELARVARSADPPAVKLEGALEILFGAYGESDREFSALLLNGWVRARDDKHFRLALAWQREQLRLSIEEILADGVARGACRTGVDPGAAVALVAPGLEEEAARVAVDDRLDDEHAGDRGLAHLQERSLGFGVSTSLPRSLITGSAPSSAPDDMRA
jgi:hypothetical protein